MTLIVESGAGVANANSYKAAADLVAYAAPRGVTLTDVQAEALLVKAMDRMAGLDYIGQRATRDQALDWPRYCVCIDGYTYLSTELPKQLGDAQLALALAANSADLMPVVAVDDRGAVIEKTVGPLTTRYATPQQRAFAKVPAADVLLAKLLRSQGQIRVVRA